MTIDINIIVAEGENFLVEVYDEADYNGGDPTVEPIHTLSIGNNTIPYSGSQVILVSPVGGSEIPNVTNNPSGPVFNPWYFQKIAGTEKWYLYTYNFSSVTYVDITVTAIGGSATVNPSNKIHLVTPDDIKELYTKNLFTIIGSGENAVEVSAVDYIIQLMKFPFEVPEDSIGDNLNIILGSYDTEINTPLANTDIIPIDFGSIEVPAAESSLDYELVSYFLQVPQVEGEIELDMSDISGKVIFIKGLFDVYNGDLTINVYNHVPVEEMDEPEPFLSVKRGLGREIPIINRKEKVIGSLGAQIGNDNELIKARIVKKYPEIIEGEQNNLIELSGNLSGLTGYVEVDSIKLDFNTIGNEKDAILNELRQGVYIK